MVPKVLSFIPWLEIYVSLCGFVCKAKHRDHNENLQSAMLSGQLVSFSCKADFFN